MNTTYNREHFKKAIEKVSHGDSQTKIAKNALSNQSTVSKWLDIEGSAMPSAENLLALAVNYNCSVDYLLGIEPSKEDLLNKTPSFEELLNCIVALSLHSSAVLSHSAEATEMDLSSNPDESNIVPLFSRKASLTWQSYDESFTGTYEGRKEALLEDCIADFISKLDALKKAGFDNEMFITFSAALVEKATIDYENKLVELEIESDNLPFN